jgi:ankyrin repeat protein
MTIFIDSSNPNYFRNISKEIDRAQNKDEQNNNTQTLFLDFQKTGVLIGKVQESQWGVSDLKKFHSGIEEQLKDAHKKLEQPQNNSKPYNLRRRKSSPQVLPPLHDLEDMLQAFLKIEKVASDLAEKSTQIFAGKQISANKVTSKNKALQKNIHDIVVKMRMSASEILRKDAQNIDFAKLLETENSFLNAAIAANNKDLAFKLIESGTDVDSYSSTGETPLLFACKSGAADIATALLGKGADSNQRDKSGMAVLMIACLKDQRSLVNCLLAHGAQVDIEHSSGTTSFVLACQKGYFEIAEALLAKGADRNKKNKDGNTALHLACRAGKLNVVEWLLKHDAQVDCADPEGNTPLILACTCGSFEIAKALLAKGADANKKNTNGTAALHCTCANGYFNIVLELLKYGAIVDIENAYESTSLILACQAGHLEIAKILLTERASINKIDKNGWSPLHIAWEKDHQNIIHWLLEQGALVDIEDAGGYTLFINACEEGRLELAQSLFAKGADVNKKNKEGNTALHRACSNGKNNVVQWLLEHDAQVDCENSTGMTPLTLACHKGHLEVAQALVTKGAPINKLDKDGWSPLLIACDDGHLNIIHWLLGQGALVDIEDTDGTTPLIYACMKGHLEIAQALLAKGAAVNKLDKMGWTPLLIASEKKSMNLINLLFEHGAHVDIEDAHESTPFIFACQKGLLEIAQALLAKGAAINKLDKKGLTPLLAACGNGHLHIVHWLLEQGAEVDKENSKGSTPLIYACGEGLLEIAKALFGKGAAINKKDKSGKTALHHACYKGKLNEVNWLLEHGAQVDSEEADGSTPLALACQEGHYDVVKALLAKGATINKKNIHGTTALHRSCTKGHFNIVEELLKQGALVDSENENETTPLILACMAGHLEIAQALVACGAVVNKEDKRGWTPLLIACEMQKLNIVRWLLDKAQIDFEDAQGTTPLILALQKGNLEIAQALLAKGADVNKKNRYGNSALSLSLETGFPNLIEAFFAQNINESLLFSFTNGTTILHRLFTNPALLKPKLIAALFLKLCKNFDVTCKDNNKNTPLRCLLEIQYIEPTLCAFEIIKELFCDFEGIEKVLDVHGVKGFLTYFTEHPDELLKNPKNLAANPFAIALLFDDKALAKALASKMTKEQFQEFALQLEKSYPKTQAFEFMFNIEYSINSEHLTNGVCTSKIAPKPETSSADDFLKLFDQVNFSDPNASFYFDPAKLGFGADKTRQYLRKISEDFVAKVKARKGFPGDHQEGSVLHTEFYDTVENGICGIAHHLLTQEDGEQIQQLKAKTIIEFLKDVVYCGPKVRATCVRQYNKVVRSYAHTFDNLLFSNITYYRTLIADAVTPNGPQSTHDYLLVVKLLGKDFGLPEAADLGKFDDIFRQSGVGINPEELKKAFFEIYTPYNILKQTVAEIQESHEFREQYATWWQQHAPDNWKGDLADVLQEVKNLQKNNTPSDVQAYLNSKDIFVEKDEKPEDVLETLRCQNFVLQEVYENVAKNSFNKRYIIQSLEKLNVIKPAIIFAEG